ncbi:MAG: tRNA pseudouridine(55) synthase TruB [Patescibacteria group bacterium]
MTLPDKPIIAVWKPKGPTSFRVIHELRKITGITKIGHAGTLDPLAEGILIIGLGREGTRQLNDPAFKEKEYEATVKLGETSATDDGEGPTEKQEVKDIPDISKVEQVIKKYIGQINQIPPPYSALKVKGKTAYALARKGKVLNLPARPVEIKNIELQDYTWPFLKIKVVTGPGVYIRSLARDIGRELGTGGYLTKLIRTRVGTYTRREAEEIVIPFTAKNKKEEAPQE